MAIISNLIARFTADTTAFEKGTQRARRNLHTFNSSVGSVGRSLVRLAGIGGGLYLAQRALRGMMTATMNQEDAERALQAAVGRSIDQYKTHAAALQKVTIYGDEQILNQMAYARNLGVTADKLNAASTAAVGLAAKYRIDLSAAMMLIGRASQGQTQMLTRYGIVLDETLSTQEKFEELLRLGAEAMNLAAAEAETTRGAWAQFSNTVGDLAEKIGDRLLPRLTQLAQRMTDVIDRTNESSAAYKAYKQLTDDVRAGTNQPLMALSGRGSGVHQPQYPNIYAMLRKQAEEGIAPGFYPPQSVIDAAARKMATAPGPAPPAELSAEAKRMAALRARVAEEIELTGRLDEPRQHAKMMVEFQAAAAAEYGENTERAIAATRSFRAELDRLAEAEGLARLAQSIGEAFTSAFEQAILEARNLNDVLTALARNLQASFFQEFVSRPLSQAIAGVAGGMMGATVAHGGGVLGRDRMPGRMVDSSVFLGAPKFHGLAPGDVAVIAQRGEQISRPGASEGSGGEGVTIVNNFYAQAVDRRGVSQLLRDYSREVAAAQKMAVLNNQGGR